MEPGKNISQNKNNISSQEQIKVIHKQENSNNIKHQQVDLDRLNKNKENDPITQRLIKEDKMLLFITLTKDVI